MTRNLKEEIQKRQIEGTIMKKERSHAQIQNGE